MNTRSTTAARPSQDSSRTSGRHSAPSPATRAEELKERLLGLAAARSGDGRHLAPDARDADRWTPRREEAHRHLVGDPLETALHAGHVRPPGDLGPRMTATVLVGAVGLSGSGAVDADRWSEALRTPEGDVRELPATPVYRHGGLVITDEASKDRSSLTPTQRLVHRVLTAQLGEHQRLGEEAAALPAEERALFEGLGADLDALLAVAFPPEASFPAHFYRIEPELPRPHEKTLDAAALQRVADHFAARGLPLEDVQDLFYDRGITDIPDSAFELGRSFSLMLVGGQLVVDVPHADDGRPVLESHQVATLHLFEALDPATRERLRQMVGYGGPAEGNGALQEQHLGNDVVDVALLDRLHGHFTHYGVDLAPFANGTDAAGANGAVGALDHAIAEEQRRIEEERRRPASPTDHFELVVTSAYNPNRPHPITGKVSRHNGTDFRAPQGTGLNSVFPGTVTHAGPNSTFGLHVRVDHGMIDLYGDGVLHHVESTYSHLSRVDVQVGQQLEKGANLGPSGNTGDSAAPHLHFELWVDGARVDPMAALDLQARYL